VRAWQIQETEYRRQNTGDRIQETEYRRQNREDRIQENPLECGDLAPL
jgi:hypothetical protein